MLKMKKKHNYIDVIIVGILSFMSGIGITIMFLPMIIQGLSIVLRFVKGVN